MLQRRHWAGPCAVLVCKTELLGTNWVQDLKQLDWRCDVAKIVKKSFDAPEETRSLHKGKIEAVDLGVLRSGA